MQDCSLATSQQSSRCSTKSKIDRCDHRNCKIALGGEPQFHTIQEFDLLPTDAFAVFGENESANQPLILFLSNNTSGTKDLHIEQINISGVSLDLPVFYYDSNKLDVTLQPSALMPVLFYVRVPKNQPEVYSASIVVKDKHSSQTATTNVTIYPFEATIANARIDPGKFRANAIVLASAKGVADYNSSDNEWHNIPCNIAAVPALGFYGALAHASSQGSLSITTNTKRQVCGTLSVLSSLGGTCGSTAMNASGGGRIRVEYKTTLILPTAYQKSSWTLSINGKFNGTEVSQYPSAKSPDPCRVAITGNSLVKRFTFDFGADITNAQFPDLPPGTYSLELSAPELLSSCGGAPSGVTKSGQSSIDLDISLLRHDR